jgi:hypothetical protein
VDSFTEFCRIMADIGADELRVQPLMGTGRASECYESMCPTSEQYLKLWASIQKLNLEHGQKTGVGNWIIWGDPLEHVWVYAMTDVVPQYLSIQSNGWYELSPYMPVLVGDACKHSVRELWELSIKDIWRSPLVQHYADTLLTLDGMKKLYPKIYSDRHVMIDWFDEENRALAMQTADPDALIDFAKAKGFYAQGCDA